MEGQMQAINELLVTPEFLDEIRKAGSDEDVQKIFGVHGIRLSLEEVAQMLDAFIAHRESRSSPPLVNLS